MLGKFRLVIVLSLAALALLLLLPFQIIGLMCWPKLAGWVPVIFHRILLKLFGVRVKVVGSPTGARPHMMVVNHVSWLDIPVLSAVEPLSFVAKADMAVWPFFGKLAKLQRTIFVQREARRSSGEQANDIAGRLSAKDTIVLFPEGTTSDGNLLYPFKTPLFEAARYALVASEQDHAVIQPVAIEYASLHGLPISRQWRPLIAWPGDVGLAEHFLPLVARGALDVTVHFGEPILFTAESKRKIVAAQARANIRAMLTGEALDSFPTSR